MALTLSYNDLESRGAGMSTLARFNKYNGYPLPDDKFNIADMSQLALPNRPPYHDFVTIMSLFAVDRYARRRISDELCNTKNHVDTLYNILNDDKYWRHKHESI